MNTTSYNKPLRGFTILELLIVLAIIGIISAVGYPSYIEHIKKGKRIIAQGELSALSTAMNQYFVQNNSSYVGAGTAGGPPTIYSSDVEIDGQVVYKLTIDSISAAAFTLKATPQTGTTQEGDGFFTLTQDGTKVWNVGGVVHAW